MLKIQTRDSLACRSKGYGTPVTVTSVGHLFKEVMGHVFNVDTLYILVHEFAKSQGMFHWHGLFWPSDREPHNLFAGSKGNYWWPTPDLARVPSPPDGKRSSFEIIYWCKEIPGIAFGRPSLSCQRD